MNTMIGNRDLSVDIAKGIGIILVVWAHTKMSDLVFSFHMPLFFILSGFFIKDEDTGFFLYKKYRTLLFPLAFFYVLSLIAKLVLRFLILDKNELVGQITSGSIFSLTTVDVTLWFLVCLWIMLMIFHFINCYVSNLYLKIVLIGILFLGGCLCFKKTIEIPCYIVQACICLPFLYVGRVYNSFLKKYFHSFTLLCTSLIVFIISYSIFEPKTNLLQYHISGIAAFLLPALSGSFSVIGLSQCMAKYPDRLTSKIISSVGMTSMSIMVLSEDVRVVFKFCDGVTTSVWVNVFIETALIVFITYLVGKVLDSKCPYIWKNVPFKSEK